MNKDWILALVVTVATGAVVLLLVRWLAPGLIGVPVDLQMVQTSKKVPPFFENIFRYEDLSAPSMVLQDPSIVNRGRPLLPDLVTVGPNDILGFRNRNVPSVAEIISIGDSQTYGNNALAELNWPSTLQRKLKPVRDLRVYNMSVGAWGGINYLAAAEIALYFRPGIVIVALYTGNDSLSDFRIAYSYDQWSEFRVNPNLDASDAPAVSFPVPESETWSVRFKDGVATVFTPRYRLFANDRQDETVMAGYEIMARASKRIAERLTAANIVPVFTIIPTKELVYARKIVKDNISAVPAYEKLISDEQENLRTLQEKISGLPGGIFIDVLTPLQQAADAGVILYPDNENGHPVDAGYEVIAQALFEGIAQLLQAAPSGLVAVINDGGEVAGLQLLQPEGRWAFRNNKIAADSGWSLQGVRGVPARDLANTPYLGIIEEADAAKWGPDADDHANGSESPGEAD